MKIKKVVLLFMLLTLFGAILGGCTPKETDLWVMSGEVKFNIKAQAFDVVYDGNVREFSVKSKENFEKKLKEVPEFKNGYTLADTGKEAFVFEKNGKYFVVYNKESNRYVLRRAQSVICRDNQEIWFDCIPLEAFADLEIGVEVCYEWEEIKEHFQVYTTAEINDDSKQIKISVEDKFVVLTLEGTILKAMI